MGYIGIIRDYRLIGYILGLYWGYKGTMEKKMETTIVYWGYIDIGIMENKMETAVTYWGSTYIAEMSMLKRDPQN